ncbi:MAG: hypothetical protein WBA41_00670, partial [Rivularia sp. (in: cyanobacteria)]
AQQLADKYLGADFKPDYGHLIGICTLTETVKMTPKLIQAKSSREIELGIWESGRVAWQATDKRLFKVPIAATGKQAAPWKPSEELIELVKQEIYLMTLKNDDDLIANQTETSYGKIYVISWKEKGNPIDTYTAIPEHIGRIDELNSRCKHIESLGLKPCIRNCNNLNYKYYRNLKPNAVDSPFPWVIENYWNHPDKWKQIDKEHFEQYSYDEKFPWLNQKYPEINDGFVSNEIIMHNEQNQPVFLACRKVNNEYYAQLMTIEDSKTKMYETIK